MAANEYWRLFLEDGFKYDFTGLQNNVVYYRCTVCSSERCFSVTKAEDVERYGEVRNTEWYNAGPCSDTSFHPKWLLAAECTRGQHTLDRIDPGGQRFGLFDRTYPSPAQQLGQFAAYLYR